MTRYISPVKPSASEGIVADVYRQMKCDFGAVVDPFAIHSVSPRLLAAVWAAGRESELVGIVPREMKEAVAVTISQLNDVPYCVDAHSVMLHAIQSPSVADALTSDRIDQLSDRVQVICAWARTSGSAHSAALNRPFGDEEAPELIGTAVFFHYMNRMVAVLLDETPLPSSQRWLRGFLLKCAGWMFSSAARRPKTPGDSLAFMPEAELPPDMTWAAACPSAARAWAGLAHEVDRLGRATLPTETIAFASGYIQAWNGNTSQMNRLSIEDAIQQLGPEHRSSARLVLLTAIAPHQVDEQAVCEFVDPKCEQEKLLGALSWASFTAARRIGSWLHAAKPAALVTAPAAAC